MLIRRAKYAGACYGVQRALDMTEQASEEELSVSTYGPLIHNPRVVQELTEKGIEAVDDLGKLTTEAVVIRSHGVAPEVIEELEDDHRVVIDATCPHVTRAQKAAARMAKEGYFVLVVGEAGHPEVEGISAYARSVGGTCAVVASRDDIPRDLKGPVGIVVQTTQSQKRLAEVVDALKEQGLDPLVKNTICSATAQRQQSAQELAGEVDCMVVIGGRNSSNTTRLYELCLEHCPKAYHIEGAEEIDPAWFEGCEVIGITAGASTPETQIETVISHLEHLAVS